MANTEVVWGTKVTAAKSGEVLAGSSAPPGQALGDLWVNTAPTNENRPRFQNDASGARKWEQDIGVRCIWQDRAYGSVSSAVADSTVYTVSGISLTLGSLSYIVKFQVKTKDSNSSNNNDFGLKLNATIVNSTTTNYIYRAVGAYYDEIELWLPYHGAIAGQFGHAIAAQNGDSSIGIRNQKLLGLNANLPDTITSITVLGVSPGATGTLYAGFMEIWEIF